jgi:tight adherence protein C
MLILFACLLIVASVLVLGMSVRLSRRTTAEAIRSVSSYGYGAEPVVSVGNREAGNQALERSFASIARRFTPDDYESRLKLRLIQAGMYDARPSRFLMLRVLSAMIFATVGLLYARGSDMPLLALVVVVAAPLLGWLLPDPMLSARINRRLARIERDAADFIDLLAITVQAGLGLDQSMKIAAERLHGPLADEVRLMLNEIRVGQSRQEALRRLAERADTPTVRSFARTMAQGESMGVSIGQTLKALAIDARARKKALADELAQKAPVKMVFPLAICFFPAILIITAGPGIIAIMNTLGG